MDLKAICFVVVRCVGDAVVRGRVLVWASTVLMGVTIAQGQDSCATRDAWLKAKGEAEAAQAVYGKAIQPKYFNDRLQATLDGLQVRTVIDLLNLGEFDDVRLSEAVIRMLEKEAGAGDKVAGQRAQELRDWLKVRKARDGAAKALEAAEAEYWKVLQAAGGPVAAAQREFDAEQAWIKEQKAGLSGNARDEGYKQGVLRIMAHARSSYEKIQRDLASFKCVAGAASLLDKLDDCLRRIAELEAKLGVERADAPTTAAGVAATDKELTNQPPLGDLYVAEQPEVKAGANVSAKDEEFSFSLEQDGKTGQGKVTFQGIPKKVRVGELVTLKVQAAASEPALAFGAFSCNNVQGSPPAGFADAGSFPGWRSGSYNSGVYKFYFGAGLNPSIAVEGGRYNDPDGSRTARITVKYRKSE